MVTAIEFAILAKDHASEVFKKVGEETDKSSHKLGAFHKVGKAAGIAFAGGAILAAKAAEEMTKKAAENQQSQALLARQLKTSTGATKEQTAAAEEWITKQGESLGVTKDELRPALAKLAVATGSVSKAQKLASLAMNVSAGTGKSLTSVAFALAKAQNGNVSGLARLGIQTQKTSKDNVALQKAVTAVKSAQLAYTAAVKAHGRHSVEASIAADKLKQAHEGIGIALQKTKKTTLSLDAITKNLAKTYSGAAATSAKTTAGQQKILAVQMDELQVKIGTALIPVMNKLVSVGLQVVNWISHNTKTAGVLIGVVAGLAAATWAVSVATKAWFAITKVAAVTTKAFAAAQWLLNTAMDANPIGVVVIAVAALAAGLIYAYKHSATFRKIVQDAFHAVATAAKAAFGWIKNAASTVFDWLKGHWKLILAIVGGPIVAATILVVSNWGKIKAGGVAVWNWIKSAFSKVFAFITQPFRDGIAVINAAWNAFQAGGVRLIAFVKGLPARVLSGIGNVGHLLFSVGQNVISGFIHGIESMAGALIGAIRSTITDHLPGFVKKALGIQSPSKVFIGIGVNLMEGLIKGIGSHMIPLNTMLSKVTAAVQAAGQKLQAAVQTRNSFAGGFQSFATSVFGNSSTTDANGNTVAPNMASILAFQKQQAQQARMVKRDVRRLVHMGLSPALIKQLQAAGASGIPEIEALAGGSRAQIKQLNSLNHQTSSDLQSAGMSAANSLYGKQIRQDEKNLHQLQRLQHSIEDLVHHLKHPNNYEFTIRGNDLVAVLKKTHRVTGAHP